MSPISHSLKLASRTLRRSPGFTLVAVLTLALGIGANAAIFSIVYAVLMKPLPFERPEELYGLWHTGHGIGIPQVEQTNTTYTIYRELSESFVDIGLYNDGFSMNLTEVGEPVRVDTAAVTASLFDVLGVSPSLGRPFAESDDDPGAPQVAILSAAIWQGRFGADPGVLGRRILLNGTPWEIVGVMPSGFAYPGETTEIWIPHVILPAEMGQVNFSHDAVGRLRTGVSPNAASEELARILAQMPELYPGELTAGLLESAQLTPYLTPLLTDIVGDVSQVLWILLGTVGFVLLIACANVANLFLVRAEGRQRELALRASLGAGLGDVVMQFLVESLALAALGGAVGLALAQALLRTIIALSPAEIPRLSEVGLDLEVLAFTALISLVAGLSFGLIPVLRYRRPNIVNALNEGSLRASAGRETHFARGALVVVQIALALVLLIGSGLMARSFWQLSSVEPGFDASGLLTLRLSLPRAEYPGTDDAADFYQRLMGELEALPGVTRVGAVSNLPMTDSSSNNGAVLEDFPLAADEIPPIVRTNYATPGYFETLSIPLKEGRTFEVRDHEERTGAVVVSEGFAEQHWPTQSALGRRLTPGLAGDDVRWYTIVGIVGDVHDDGLAQEPPPIVYYPVIGLGGNYGDWVRRSMSVAIRTELPPMSLAAAVRDRVWQLDPALPLINIRSGEAIVSASTASTSYAMILLAIAAGVALLLGAVGVYGVISYIVGQRTREIGIRIAVGAGRGDVNRMVLRQGMRLTLVGIAVGLVAAFGVTRFMASLLFGVASTDASTFVVLSLVLIAVSGLASFIPAWRASGTNPTEALRA